MGTKAGGWVGGWKKKNKINTWFIEEMSPQEEECTFAWFYTKTIKPCIYSPEYLASKGSININVAVFPVNSWTRKPGSFKASLTIYRQVRPLKSNNNLKTIKVILSSIEEELIGNPSIIPDLLKSLYSNKDHSTVVKVVPHKSKYKMTPVVSRFVSIGSQFSSLSQILNNINIDNGTKVIRINNSRVPLELSITGNWDINGESYGFDSTVINSPNIFLPIVCDAAKAALDLDGEAAKSFELNKTVSKLFAKPDAPSIGSSVSSLPKKGIDNPVTT